ncbi:MAG: TapY2 family type IVa secretion system protein [Litorilituus sp.]|jgi:hypothetical protein|nr:TapY2 family type IVa secretion system protein [Litorilituus sp.]
MENQVKRLFFILIFFLSTVSLANSSASSSKDELQSKEKIDVKCYVELVGGGETISLWHIKPSLLKGLGAYIVGRKIRVVGKKKKAYIYKVKECVLDKDDFSHATANLIDKTLGR